MPRILLCFQMFHTSSNAQDIRYLGLQLAQMTLHHHLRILSEIVFTNDLYDLTGSAVKSL